MGASGAAAGMSFAGGGLGAIGTLQEGAAKQQAGEYNARIAEYNAGQLEAESIVAVQKHDREVAQTVGSARAGYGASGISSSEGSALDQLQNQAERGAIDSLYLKQGYASKAYGYRATAVMNRYEGDMAKESSYYSAAGQLLGGAGSGLSKL